MMLLTEGKTGVFFFVFFAVAMVVVLSWPFTPVFSGDVEWYISIAEGRIHEVIKPFSGRVLFPLLSAGVSGILGVGLETGFLAVTMLSLSLFFALFSFTLIDILRRPILLVPLIFLPYFVYMSGEYFLPDIFYIFLSGMFFMALLGSKEVLALAVLFLMFLTRESTVLLGGVFLIVALFRGKKALLGGALFVIAVSITVASWVGDMGLPNRHGIGNFPYLFFKIPYYFFNNILGVRLWSNTLANCEPAFRFILPDWLSSGSLNEAGVCGFEIFALLQTFISLFTIAGVMPALLVFVVWNRRKEIWQKSPPWLITAIMYGVSSCIVGIFVTPSAERFVGFALPPLILALPFLLKSFFDPDSKLIIKLSVIHLFVAWLPFILRGLGLLETANSLVLVVAAAFILNMYAVFLIKPALFKSSFYEGSWERLAP